MTDEKRFLNAATRGLSRKARANAQAELDSHLHECTQQLLLDGKSKDEAKAQARAELGPATALAWKFLQTHPIHWTTVLLGIGFFAVVPGFLGELLSRIFP